MIVRYSRENTEFLLAKGIKLLVVACNTSSAVALERIARHTMVPVIGVIEPGARAAVKASRSGKIGVIGTEATIASGAYTRAIQSLKPARGNLYARVSAAGAAGRGGLDRQRYRGADRRALSREPEGERYRYAAAGMHALSAAAAECSRKCSGAGVKIVDSATATAAAVREKLSGAEADAARRRRRAEFLRHRDARTGSSGWDGVLSAREWNPPSASSAEMRAARVRYR